MVVWFGTLAVQGAEPVFLPEGQLRPRWEADSGRDGIAGGEVSYVSMRSRLGATLELDDVYGRMVVSDVRVLGSELDTRRDFDAEGIDLRIAVLGWRRGAFELEIGRLERGLHDERLIAIANWRQAGRVFDGVRASWGAEAWGLEARALLVREGDQLDLATTDQAVPGGRDQGLYVLTGGIDTETLQLWPTLVVDVDGDAERVRGTVGAWSRLAKGAGVLRTEAYLQAGQQGDARIGAGMLGVWGTWSLDAPGRPVLGLGYDLLSGDAQDDDRIGAFHTLYGANHRYYGHIDLAMFQVGGFGDGQGLQDLRAGATLHPADGIRAQLDLHAFLAAIDGSLLAVEPDLELRIALAEPLTLSAGVNLWLPPQGRSEWMGWSMLDARF